MDSEASTPLLQNERTKHNMRALRAIALTVGKTKVAQNKNYKESDRDTSRIDSETPSKRSENDDGIHHESTITRQDTKAVTRSWRRAVFLCLQADHHIHFVQEVSHNPYSTIAHWYEALILVIVLINIVPNMIDTHEISGHEFIYGRTFQEYFEPITCAIFTSDYILRVWTAVEDKRLSKSKQEPQKAQVFGCTQCVSDIWHHPRARYCRSMQALVDLFVNGILYAEIYEWLANGQTIGMKALQNLRIFRLFRVFSLMRLERYSNSIDLISKVVKKQKHELFSTLFMAFVLLIVSATIMFYLEKDAQPDSFGLGIPTTMWWAVTALTTVGYGDMYPMTGAGRVFASILAFAGISIFALPAGIIASGFTEQVDEEVAEEIEADVKEFTEEVDKLENAAETLQSTAETLQSTAQETIGIEKHIEEDERKIEKDERKMEKKIEKMENTLEEVKGRLESIENTQKEVVDLLRKVLDTSRASTSVGTRSPARRAAFDSMDSSKADQSSNRLADVMNRSKISRLSSPKKT